MHVVSLGEFSLGSTFVAFDLIAVVVAAAAVFAVIVAAVDVVVVVVGLAMVAPVVWVDASDVVFHAFSIGLVLTPHR